VSPQSSLGDGEREKLLAEVRHHLPAFLRADATEQQDPAGDVRELLDLAEEDLQRVLAVHVCLDETVLAFGAALEEGLRNPFPSSAPRHVRSRSVRGPIVWGRTATMRALSPSESSSFVVREPGKAVDTCENRAVAWLLRRLESLVDAATFWNARPEAGDVDPTWQQKIDRLSAHLAAARRVQWLSGLRPERPTAATLRSLSVARSGFYGERVVPALKSAMRLDAPSPEDLAEVLSQRYFEPHDDGTLFEVAIALRLAGAFAAGGSRPRLTRLLIGEGKSSFARYALEGGAEVWLAYQSWPDDQQTLRRRLGDRHALGSRDARPDIMVMRTKPDPDSAVLEDTVILELKASLRAAYLRQGLSELLAYLADRPGLWGEPPAGWLVAPASDAFEECEPDPEYPLWVVSADRVAAAVASRFLPAGE
jgi:hypothetical protein